MKYFRGNWLKNTLLCLKSDLLRIKLRSTERIIFSNKYEQDKSCGNIFDLVDFFFFLLKPVKRRNYDQIFFPPKNEPNTAKRSFSGVLKYFCRNSLKTSFWSKVLSQNDAKNCIEINFFSTSLKRGKSWGKHSFDEKKFGQIRGTGHFFIKTVFTSKYTTYS